MATYKSFKHVERLGKDEVDGILDGVCYITAKLDGTNALVWFDDKEQTVCAGSRKRQLTLEDDNAGFYKWVHSDNEEAKLLRHFVEVHDELIVYGEFGCGKVAHIKDYNEGTKDQFWIFDVYNVETEQYVPDTIWRELLEAYDLTPWCIPILATIENPTEDQLMELAKNNKFLLDHANHAGEGIVIRNPDFRNRWGHYEIAKIVLDEYIQEQKSKKKPQITPGEVEQSIVDLYATEAELSKAKNKVCVILGTEEFDTKSGKFIGMYLNMVYRESILAEVADWVKKFKNPVIDFKTLQDLTYKKARAYLGLG